MDHGFHSFFKKSPPPFHEGEKWRIKPVPIVSTEQGPDTPQLERYNSKTVSVTPYGSSLDGLNLSKASSRHRESFANSLMTS